MHILEDLLPAVSARRIKDTHGSMSSSSRAAATANPPLATPTITIDPTANVSDKASLTGTHAITIGLRAIIHPFARLDSSAGPIDIGEAVNVWEKAVVGAPPVDKSVKEQVGRETTIAAHASIHPHAIVYAFSNIGAHTDVEVGASIGTGAVLGEHVKIAPCCIIEAGVNLEPYTSVYLLGDRQMQRINATMKENEEVRELYEKGREREHTLLKRLVKGNNMKWAA